MNNNNYTNRFLITTLIMLICMMSVTNQTLAQEAYAVFDASTATLTLKYDNNKPATAYSIRTSRNSGWSSRYQTIQKIVFDDSFKEYKPTSCAYWFDYCSQITEINGLNNLNTEIVTDMSYMFNKCSKLTSIDLSGFNTKNVTNMDNMFCDCFSLTALDLSGFNTEKVTNMNFMFYSCSELRTIFVDDGWNTDIVTYSYDMFNGYKLYGGKGSTVYDYQLTDKTYARIDGGEDNPGYFTKKGEQPYTPDGYPYAVLDNETLTFYYGKNKPDNAYEIWQVRSYQGWKSNVKKVVFDNSFKEYHPKNCSYWFYDCNNLTDIEGMVQNLNTDKITNMNGMFNGCSSLTTLDLSTFNTENVTDMNYMFSGCNELQTIFVADDWDTDLVTYSYDMFGTYYSWDRESRCNKLYGGKGSTIYDYELTDKTYARIDGGEDRPGYFTKKGEQPYTPDGYPYAVLENETLYFYYGKNKPDGAYDMWEVGTPYVSWKSNVKKVVFNNSFKEYHPKNCSNWFHYCTNLTDIEGIKQNLNTVNVVKMDSMFKYCRSLTTIDLSGFNTEKVTSMSSMFDDCSSLTNLDLSSFNTEKVTNMDYMFSGCSSLTALDLSGFNTEMVTNMSSMFSYSKSLTTLDLSGFNTEKVTNMNYMFSGCSSLTNLDLSSFNTEKVTNMNYMFSGCSSLTALDLSGFNTKNVIQMDNMFEGTTLKTIFVNNDWNLDAVNEWSSKYVFSGCNQLYGSKGSSVYDYGTDAIFARIDGGEDNPGYFTKKGEQPYTRDTYPYAVLDNETLTFYYGKNKPDNAYEIWQVGSSQGWKSNVKKVIFDNSFKEYQPKNCSYWFYGCSNLTDIEGMGKNLNTNKVMNMSYMFSYCRSLTALDLNGFNTENVTDLSYMFYGCSSLKTIYITDCWNTDKIEKSYNMFYNCPNLIGEKGTVYNSSKTDKSYAHIDGGEDNPGYLTKKIIISIEVSALPTQTKYIEGQELKLNGGEITAKYNDGTSQTIALSDPKVSVSGYDPTKIGKQTLSVAYGEKETSFDVTVLEKTIVSIAVTTSPYKNIYTKGERFDPEDGEITVKYINGDKEIVELSKTEISGYDRNKVGTQTLTVSYLGMETTFEIVVKDKEENTDNPSTPVSSITPASSVKIWSYNNTLYVEANSGTSFRLVDLNGRTILKSTTKSSHEEFAIGRKGVFIVKTGDTTQKIIIQ